MSPSHGAAQEKAEVSNPAQLDYMRAVRAHLSKFIVKPAPRHAGQTLVSFTIRADGTLATVEVAKSSGHGDLDSAAILSVKKAAPFPPIPAAFGKKILLFTVPFAFVAARKAEPRP